MTTNSTGQSAPLVTRWAERLMDQVLLLQDQFGGSEDPLPMAVQRRADGGIVSRDTTLTEVRTETTDDN